MTDRFERRFHRFDRRQGGSGRAGDHHDLEPKQARGLDLGIGRRAAAVLGDDSVDTVLPHQFDFALEREGATVENIFDIGKGERRIDGIDAAHKVEMLRRDLGMVGALPAGRQEDAARSRPKGCNRLRNIGHDMPVVARFRQPFGADERKCRDTRASGGHRSIGRNAFGEGMGGIDQQAVAAFGQESRQAVGPAETADTDRNRLSGRGLRAAGKRQQDVELFARGKFRGQSARLAGAAEDQDTGLLHV